MAKDEAAVRNMQSTLDNLPDPFSSDPDMPLINLLSGVAAPKQVEDNLLHASEKGEEQFQTFVNERLRQGTASFLAKNSPKQTENIQQPDQN